MLQCSRSILLMLCHASWEWNRRVAALKKWSSMMQYYVLAGSGGVNAMTVNLQRSTFAANISYNSSIIVTIRNGQPSCTHFTPYIDLSTGELKAEVCLQFCCPYQDLNTNTFCCDNLQRSIQVTVLIIAISSSRRHESFLERCIYLHGAAKTKNSQYKY